MALSGEFDREITEITRMHLNGELSKDEFESKKKEIVTRHLKNAYEKKIESGHISKNKLSRGNKGILLLLILFIVSLSTYALVSNAQYLEPVGDTQGEEKTIIEKIVSIPKVVIESEETYSISPVDKALRDDKSNYIFSSDEFIPLSNRILGNLPLSHMTAMSMNSFSLDGAVGVVNLSVVRSGYAIYPSKSVDGSEVYVTLFLVEPGKQNTFFREIYNYIGSFDRLREGYTKEGSAVSTELSNVQYTYTLTENSNKYPVKVTSLKTSNIVGFIYYLDPKGVFPQQDEVEKSVRNVLKSYE